MIIATINIIAFILVIIGGINWGLVGIFDFNLVSAIFGAGQTVGSVVVYVLVFLAALWLIFSAIYQKRKIVLCPEQTQSLETKHYNIEKNWYENSHNCEFFYELNIIIEYLSLLWYTYIQWRK